MSNDQPESTIVRGPLALNLVTGILVGPAGTTVVTPAVATTLALLLRQDWLAPDSMVGLTSSGYRVRVCRARAALDAVGARWVLLRLRSGCYTVALRRDGTMRAYVGGQIRRLDKLLASHPNRQAVARLLNG